MDLTLPIPDYQTLMLPLLKLFASGKKNVNECLPELIIQFGISEEEAAEVVPSGRKTYLADRAHWARTYMSKAGLLESPRRNQHEITERGIEILSKNLSRIDNQVLSDFEEFSDWRIISSSADEKSPPEASTFEVQKTSPETPEAQIENANRLIEAALTEEILTLITQVDPIRFEQIILDLLNAMGFGKGSKGISQLTPASGDGGIDGVINEDSLGLDAVYIQAKRYAPETKVGRPDIQRFVGSLTGESATKGVFVTTSDFSREAREYVKRVQQRIVLINGKRLASLLIDNNIGVRVRKVYELKSVDEDYFPTE